MLQIPLLGGGPALAGHRVPRCKNWQLPSLALWRESPKYTLTGASNWHLGFSHLVKIIGVKGQLLTAPNCSAQEMCLQTSTENLPWLNNCKSEFVTLYQIGKFIFCLYKDPLPNKQSSTFLQEYLHDSEGWYLPSEVSMETQPPNVNYQQVHRIVGINPF